MYHDNIRKIYDSLTLCLETHITCSVYRLIIMSTLHLHQTVSSGESVTRHTELI